MSLLPTTDSLNEQDIAVGHQRVYDSSLLTAHILDAGLELVELSGYLLKIVPLSIMQDWSDELLEALYEVSRELPVDECSNIFAVAKRKS